METGMLSLYHMCVFSEAVNFSSILIRFMRHNCTLSTGLDVFEDYFLICLGYLSVTMFQQILEGASWDINQAEFPGLTFKSILERKFLSMYFHV